MSTVRGLARRALKALMWIYAVALFCAAPFYLVQSLTFPRAVAAHPVTATATVSQVYIDGFGGDPALSYRYAVNGITYSGDGKDELGGRPPLDLHAGDSIPIQYAADDPSQSCTCDARANLPPPASVIVSLGVAMAVPLPALVIRALMRRRTRHLALPPNPPPLAS